MKTIKSDAMRLLPLFRKLVRYVISKIRIITPSIIKEPLKHIIPKWAWTKFTHIYPIEIRAIEFLPGQDVILLELPQRYMPFMPNGLAYVHNILKSIGIRFQTVDLNIIFYHRYHSRRILSGLDKVVSPSGYVMKDDPWDVVSADEWNKPEVIEYFRLEINEVIDAMVKARPKIVGISLCETNRKIAREVVKGIRALYPDVVILVGGYDCVYHYVGPHLFQEYDYMVIGEAELTLWPLVKALVAGEKPKDVPGVISRYDSPNRIWRSDPLLEDLDSIDFPRYDWIDINLYCSYEGKQTVPIIASRGCRWSRCRFCAECFTWRQRSPKSVVDEIEWSAEQGLRNFRFNDSDMNNDPDALLEICEEILKRRLKINFYGELRVHKRGSLKFYKHLRLAGCTNLAFGVDGWTDHALDLQMKGFTMAMVEENLRNCHGSGILVNVNMVIGVPGEIEEDVREAVDNILKCRRYIHCVQNLNILILAAGSEYYKNPERYNIHFRGEKRELYKGHPYFIPPDLWYSVNPYIDHEIRVDRLKRTYIALAAGGVNIGNYAKRQVERDSQGL